MLTHVGFILFHIQFTEYFTIHIRIISHFVIQNISLLHNYTKQIGDTMSESKLRNLSTEFANPNEIKELHNHCGTIRRLLVASINTAKNNIK